MGLLLGQRVAHRPRVVDRAFPPLLLGHPVGLRLPAHLDGARAAGVFPLLLDRHDLYPSVDAPRLRRIHDLRDWLDEA